jgi:hypothetical protein
MGEPTWSMGPAPWGSATRPLFGHYVGNKLLTLLSEMLMNLKLADMETGYKEFQ